jgi:hypothetical protein
MGCSSEASSFSGLLFFGLLTANVHWKTRSVVLREPRWLIPYPKSSHSENTFSSSTFKANLSRTDPVMADPAGGMASPYTLVYVWCIENRSCRLFYVSEFLPHLLPSPSSLRVCRKQCLIGVPYIPLQAAITLGIPRYWASQLFGGDVDARYSA